MATSKKSAKKPAKKSDKKMTMPARPLTPSAPHRFAHPFFTTTPIADRRTIPGVGKRMTDFVSKTLLPIPDPQRSTPMTLKDIIGQTGADEITKTNQMIFHTVGDTGHDGGKGEVSVSWVMSQDYKADQPATSPAFFLHLGDVNYFDNTVKGYQAQFYSPYKGYPGKIIAIPGNHDGELFFERNHQQFSSGQTKTLEEFMANFCQPKTGVPPGAGSIFRQMISQPGVYWLLQTPFANFIGLYSNIAENPGFIAGDTIGNSQKDWLTKTLTGLAKERAAGTKKALILAVHHPPVASGSEGSHSSSTEMLGDIDACCAAAGITPDIFLTGHAHNYQRFTRKFSFNNTAYHVPFFVAGMGGRGTQPVAAANGEVKGEFKYEKSFIGFGYLKVTVSTKKIIVNTFRVDDKAQKGTLFETVNLDLLTHIIT